MVVFSSKTEKFQQDLKKKSLPLNPRSSIPRLFFTQTLTPSFKEVKPKRSQPSMLLQLTVTVGQPDSQAVGQGLSMVTVGVMGQQVLAHGIVLVSALKHCHGEQSLSMD
jgi:hypothetical protein